MVNYILSIFFVFISLIDASAQKKQLDHYFPSAEKWERRRPSEFGIDSSAVQTSINFAIKNESKMPRNQESAQVLNFGKEPFSDAIGPFSTRGQETGIIIYKGYIIATWGDVERVEQTHSVTKSFLSTTIGLAVDQGLIKSIQNPVYTYLPPIELYDNTLVRKADDLGKDFFLEPFNTDHNRKITWEHLLRQTSDFEGTLWGKPDWADRPGDNTSEWLTRKRNEPGSVWKYNDTRVNALALAATLLWHKSLPEILREKIMQPIGASNTWHWAGYRNSWIVLDGKLIQSVSGGGHYGGGMFINALDMARFGLLTFHKGNWNGKQLISEKWIQYSTTPTSANHEYGFMNYFLNTEKKLLPSAPEDVFVHLGNGTNMIYVDRKNELIAVVRWIEGSAMDGFISKLLSAVKK
ncbi:MAG: serine hydrolase [Chitinophagaceae bacterium]|nr:MAG: serine hydrolase [Chitinophagaceae bacterium]